MWWSTSFALAKTGILESGLFGDVPNFVLMVGNESLFER
jgi:hypothetical protein